MPIPEYTNRIIADTARSQGVSIREPEGLANLPERMERQGKAFMQDVGELADVYLDMKQERDVGIADQFLNEFTMAKALKVQELKEKYNGGNANGIIDAYNEWQRDYLNSRKGKTEEGKLYLENDEQIAMVEKAFAQDLAKSANTMSAYVANELKSFKNTQYAARDEMLMDELAGEVDLNNMAITENMMRDNLVRRYPKQSKEFYDVQMKKKMQSALTANINNDMLTEPEYALAKLSNPYFKDKLGETETNKLLLKAGKTYVDREVDRISSEKANGNDVPVELMDWDNDSFKRYRDLIGDNNIKSYVNSKVSQQTNIKQNNLKQQKADLEKKTAVKLINELGKTEISKVIDASIRPISEQQQATAEAKVLQRDGDANVANAVRNATIANAEKEGDGDFELALKNANDAMPEGTQFIIDTYTKAKDMDIVEGKIHTYTNMERWELEALPDTDERKKQYIEDINNPSYGYFAQEQREGEIIAKTLQSITNDEYQDFSSLMVDIKNLSPRSARAIIDSWKKDEAWKQFSNYAKNDKRVPDNLDGLMVRTLNRGEQHQLSRNTFIRNAMQEQAQEDVLKYLKGHPNDVMSSQVLQQIMADSKEKVIRDNKELIELSNILKDVRQKISKSKGKEASLNTSLVASELLKRLEGNESFAELDEDELAQMAGYLINGNSIMAQYLWDNRYIDDGKTREQIKEKQKELTRSAWHRFFD